MKGIIKPLDFVMALAILLLAVLIYFVPSKSTSDSLCIYVDGKLYRCVNLNESQNEEIEVRKDFGVNKIVIDGGRVRVKESTCDNRLEIKAGEIDKAGQSLICIPNRLVVTIEGKDDYDAVTY